MSAQDKPGAKPTLLTAKMAEELAFELLGLQGAADDPDQYVEKIAAMNAIAWGFCRVVRVRSIRAKATGQET